MKENSSEAVSIIGGADGPTSVFIAGKSGKKPLKARVKRFFYTHKRKWVEKRIVPGAHTLQEVVAYAKEKYQAVETTCTLSEAGLGDAGMTVPMHTYEIKTGQGSLQLEVNWEQEFFGVSYSSVTKEKKYFTGIMKDLYCYYGVTEEDIRKKSERYRVLATILSV
jgi:hypothetical protein